jgi:hypothetical protein
MLLLIGAVLIGLSLWLPTGFNQEAARIAGASPFAGDDTLNIGLLQRQKLMFDGGAALALAGLILSTAGYLAALIRSLFDEA